MNSPLPDEPTSVSATLLARQRAEQALTQARMALDRQTRELELALARMKATLDSSTDGILVTDEHMRVTDFNEKFVHMWHLPNEALAAQDHRVLMVAMGGNFARSDEFTSRVLSIYRDAPATTFDVLALLDGRVIERHSRHQLVDGRVVGRAWTYRDVTEQRTTEESLRDESRALELMNRVGRTLSATLDLKSVVRAVTETGTQISGAKFGVFFYNVADEVLGDKLLPYTASGLSHQALNQFPRPLTSDVFSPDARDRSPVRSDDVLQESSALAGSAHDKLFNANFMVRSYLAIPVISRAGDVIGGLFFGHPRPAVFTERTEKIMLGIAAQAAVAIDNARLYETAQQAAEERKVLLEKERSARSLAEDMSALKDEFLATLSHELRTPLSAILGWVHVLRRGTHKPQDLQNALATIERNARLQAQLIDDLLDMNRIASGKVQLDIQPVDPAGFIEAALETVRPAAEGKGLRIVRELDPTVEPIPGDPARLQQVISNLLSNAIKFTPRDGTIQVQLRRLDQAAEIRVTDSGIGIAPEFVAHVFERFRQADASTTRQYGGLGLGLSIVKNLVELHGGRVYASSPGTGKGASFCVRLPLSPQHGQPASASPATPDAGMATTTAFTVVDLSGLCILVVDDDHDGRELATWVLTECRAQVLTAASAEQALAHLETHRPDVLVSDIGMPQMDGFELLKRVRALGPQRGGNVTAIALTAFARPEDRAKALHAGFVAHLSKPMNPPELVAAINQAVGRVGNTHQD